MTSCPHCGRENEDHFNFCLGCGANLKSQPAEPEIRYCAKCGAAVPPTHLFCGSCGGRVPAATAGPAAVEPGIATSDGKADHIDESNARLVLINPDGSTGDAIPLRQGDNVFGRATGPPAFKDDPYLSPDHALVQLDNDALQLIDMQSLNGVFYRIVEPTELQHGDRIRVGRQLLAFELFREADPIQRSHDGSRLMGSPRGDAWGRLVRVSGPGVSSEAFLLSGAEEVIGRERGAVVFRDDGFVSARHARITMDAGRFFLEDLRSSNGTFLKVRGTRRLRSGDLLLLGQQPVRVFVGA